MKIRAVICDVYHTLLQVEPPPVGVEEHWARLCREWLDEYRPVPLAEFHAQCDQIIAREHAFARSCGISYPEIFWPDVAAEALPELSKLDAENRGEFLYRHAGLRHRVNLMPGAADVLRMLLQKGILLGIASNAQPYTLRELDDALTSAGLSRSIFKPELVFWSFEHGFGKPDPYVFRLLNARLQTQGIAASETLMIGDRQDNDIEPARAQHWQTWQLISTAQSDVCGGWQDVCHHVLQ